MTANKRRSNAKGRNGDRVGSDSAVIILRRSLWLSPQVSALSVTARALIVELTAMYTGPHCNGRLFLSQSDAARRLGLSDKKAIKSAFDELESLGFLRCTLRGDFRVKAGGPARASTYWLNWKTKDGGQAAPDAMPSLDFGLLDRRQKRRVQQRSEAVADYTRAFFAGEDSSHWASIRAEMAMGMGEDSTPAPGGRSFSPSGEESSQHVYYQGGWGRTLTAAGLMHSMRGASEKAYVRPIAAGDTPFCAPKPPKVDQ